MTAVEFLFQELLMQSASILFRIIYCASVHATTTVRPLQLCRSRMHTHLNLWDLTLFQDISFAMSSDEL